LASLLEFDFTYPHVYRRSHGALAYPECQIISLIVVVTKLCHPFDAVERTPYSETDPTTIKIDWLKWREVRDYDKPKGMKKGEEIKTLDSDVLAMSDTKTDDYLDWYQRTWLDDRDPKSIIYLDMRIGHELTTYSAQADS
jgi:RNA polymerase I-specific transcription initiation factor RRN7